MVRRLHIAQAGEGREVAHVPARGNWRSYGAADGLVTSFVRSMVQDADGQLWFATYGGGAFRYDGHIWFGTEGGASRWDGARFENFTREDGLVHDEISSIIQDREGHIWFGTEGA